MKINKNISSALKIIAPKLENKNINWMVFGSCGLALNGMDIQPDDIDILTDEDGTLKINHALIDYQTEPLKIVPSEIFNSTMNKFLINGCLVEVMGNFKVKSRIDNQWHNVTNLLEDSKFIDLDGFKIPVLPLTKSIDLYKLMGREKDLVKIQKIETFIKLDTKWKKANQKKNVLTGTKKICLK